MVIVLDKFPTHIAKTNNKIAPNKMLKINNQAIYNGHISRFTRNIVMSNMHDYISDEIKSQCKGVIFNPSNPLRISFIINTVRNHGSISMRKGKICWKPAKTTYIPNWDIENLASIWIKAFNDVLTSSGIIPDDNIDHICAISYIYNEVQDIDDRKIEILIRQ